MFLLIILIFSSLRFFLTPGLSENVAEEFQRQQVSIHLQDTSKTSSWFSKAVIYIALTFPTYLMLPASFPVYFLSERVSKGSNCDWYLYLFNVIQHVQLYCKVQVFIALNQYPTKQPLYGHIPPISKTPQIRRTRHAGVCWRSKDELISDILEWIPSHRRIGERLLARTYLQQLCKSTRCSLEDPHESMDERGGWWEKVREIYASSMAWWWWWW